MVASANCNDFGVEVDEKGVKGGEAGAICQGWALEELGEDGFEARGVWCAKAGVDVAVCWGRNVRIAGGELQWRRVSGCRGEGVAGVQLSCEVRHTSASLIGTNLSGSEA